MSEAIGPTIYQLKVVLLGISPMIWRRLLASGDSTIAKLYFTFQIAMGWIDVHRPRFFSLSIKGLICRTIARS